MKPALDAFSSAVSKLFDTISNAIEKNRWAAAVLGLVIFLIVFLFSLTRPYQQFELTLYDLRFKMKPSTPQWDYLTFVDMEDNSIEQIGKFPWPRNVYARALDVMREVGARLASFDIEFPNESPVTVNPQILQSLRGRGGKKSSAKALDQLIINNDAIFAGGLGRFGRAVLPFSFQNMELKESETARLRRDEIARARKIFWERASVPVPPEKRAAFRSLVDPARVDILYPIPELIHAANAFGFVDSDFDMDGVARKIRLVRVFKDRMFFHLSLAMLIDICGVAKERVEVVPGSRIVLKDAWNPLKQKRGDIVIPIDGTGMAYINWAGLFYKRFNHVPFYALLEYPDVKDAVHDLFDQKDLAESKSGGASKRMRRYEELSKLYDRYAGATDAEKAALWTRINETRRQIGEIEKGYLAPIEKQVDEITSRLKKGDDPSLRRQLQELQNTLMAMNLVLQVEGLRDHTLLVGLTATASHDIGPTPVDNNFPMVGTYHNIVNMVLQDRFITPVPAAINLAIMLLVAVLIAAVVQRLSARMSIVVIVSSFLLVNLAVVLSFVAGLLWFDQLGVNLSLILPAITIGGIKFIREESQKRFIKQAFAHYMAPGVIDQIIQNPDLLQLGGENRRLTIFFSDVAGFTSISERLTAHELVNLLNEYLSEMSDIIMKHDGTVDKYEGDAIMAFYGAPYYFPDNAVKACLAAIEMQERLVDMRAAWRAAGKEQLKVRMGMNTGDVVVGNMGSKTRMDYTVMGDAVNLAARLEGVNKLYGTHAMISEFTYAEAKDHVEVRHLDRIRVVGKEEPITIYELLGRKGRLPEPVRAVVECFNEGLALFFEERDWKRARHKFREGLRINPDDGPCRLYDERCVKFISDPPSRSWDGVYRFTSK